MSRETKPFSAMAIANIQSVIDDRVRDEGASCLVEFSASTIQILLDDAKDRETLATRNAELEQELVNLRARVEAVDTWTRTGPTKPGWYRAMGIQIPQVVFYNGKDVELSGTVRRSDVRSFEWWSPEPIGFAALAPTRYRLIDRVNIAPGKWWEIGMEFEPDEINEHGQALIVTEHGVATWIEPGDFEAVTPADEGE